MSYPGQWVTVPGKGPRWQQPSGKLMTYEPGWGFVAAQFQGGLRTLSSGFGLLDRPKINADQLRHASAPALTHTGLPASVPPASPQRPEGSMATLNGKPVQWLQDSNGHSSWQPFETEGEMARRQQMARRQAPPAPVLPERGSAALAALETPAARAQLEERNRMLQQAGGGNISQRLVPTEAEADAINQRYRSPEYWATDAGKRMLALADGPTAPASSKLADYYEAQRAVGLGAQGEIVSGLTSGLSGDKAAAMKTWAEANPALALREFQKRFPKGEPTTGGDDAAIAEAMRQGQFFPSEGSPNPLPAGTPQTTAPIERPDVSYKAVPAPYAPGGVMPAALTGKEAQFPVQAGAEPLPVVAPMQAQTFNLAGPDSPLPEINGAQALVDRKTQALLAQHLAPLRAGGVR